MPFDRQTRGLIYDGIQHQIKQAQLAISAGDWNAALLAGDRPTNQTSSSPHLDQQHRAFVHQANLHHLPWEAGLAHRRHSYYSHAANEYSSRIDDILVSTPMHSLALEETIPIVTDASDHSPIVARFELSNSNFCCPPPKVPKAREPRLKTPVSNEKLHAFRERTSVKAACDIFNLQSAICSTIEEAENLIHLRDERDNTDMSSMLRAHGFDQKLLEHAQRLQELLLGKIMQTAHETLDFTDGSGPPSQIYRSRKVNRKLKKLSNRIVAIKTALQRLDDAKQAPPTPPIPSQASPHLGEIRNLAQEQNLRCIDTMPHPPVHDDLEHVRTGRMDSD